MSRRRARQPQFDSSDDLLDGARATLDLHGRTAAEARALVPGFLAAEARRSRGATVRIVTGKGKGSANGAVLRPLVASLLRGPCAHLIAEWGADTDDGGYVVRLR